MPLNICVWNIDSANYIDRVFFSAEVTCSLNTDNAIKTMGNRGTSDLLHDDILHCKPRGIVDGG